ncbi:MAG: hypothetical protein JO029_04535 [Candidatus Eremiobacteraeota bacterium]|nr:hypothetical protein [Candidatus Eremiobacteraeota bacterium]MBV8433531.1 hypothetical protein [Candidatus Eremiobacteraeota bacterium]MBV8582635.1 hypothetical protein [Candidatus Eremiobacteraeota bacterium]MBV8654582.1 hypothetical protein [Candidatus Eremiobacteraeota bacterium]
MKPYAIFLFALLFGAPYAASAATPAPSAPPKGAPVPTIALPNAPLHTEYVVEVNKRGQVVRVKSSKVSKVDTFNVQTYGNALQMWIRKPDGTATVGLFRVTYDYDPKSRKVDRNVALVSEGGTWGDEEGAANAMMETAQKEAADAQKRREEQAKSLPSLNQITGKSPAPSASPR